MAKLYKPADKIRAVKVNSPSDNLEKYRTPWRRDYARLLHSAAFRRLQGKTQLFPGNESDFFRNRLTHSLEVAQIAKSIAIRINNTESAFKGATKSIDLDLVEIAALAHDLGHPPFGHNGEYALDQCMKDAGGFEGNAQTLRILSKLEKRQTLTTDDGTPVPVKDKKDNRAGLNLTYRTLASILKYDNEIPSKFEGRSKKDGPVKGYYYTERAVVEDIKRNVGPARSGDFKTIECCIMDIADDIAYSTYDLEDAFKARFLTPLSMLSCPDLITTEVAKKVKRGLDEKYSDLPKDERVFGPEQVKEVLLRLFRKIIRNMPSLPENGDKAYNDLVTSSLVEEISSKNAGDGYYRYTFTSDLVGTFIRGVKVRVNNDNFALSSVYLDVDVFKIVETLKNFVYQSLIMSSMLKVSEHRGKDIIQKIFETLTKPDGYLLMPDDFRHMYLRLEGREQMRVVCDFIAGMTDRYAIQFYGRLFGADPESIYSPL